jgi:hypothetical protein
MPTSRLGLNEQEVAREGEYFVDWDTENTNDMKKDE